MVGAGREVGVMFPDEGRGSWQVVEAKTPHQMDPVP